VVEAWKWVKPTNPGTPSWKTPTALVAGSSLGFHRRPDFKREGFGLRTAAKHLFNLTHPHGDNRVAGRAPESHEVLIP
jgi:hypothetical protein